MKKRILSLVLAAMMVLAIVPVLEQEVSADSNAPHYFATALREFFSDNPAVSSAVLCDLDGDGDVEVVAVKGNKNENRSPATQIDEIVIFDIENGNNISVSLTAGEEPIGLVNRIYISDTNYLVMDIDVSHYKPSFYQYKDGKINKIIVASFGSDEPEQYFDFETGNPIPEEQLSQYIGTIANYTTVYSEAAYFGELPHIDQTEEIYAMTAAAVWVGDNEYYRLYAPILLDPDARFRSSFDNDYLWYGLYDLDNDGILELIVMNGNGRYMQGYYIYTIENNAAKYLGRTQHAGMSLICPDGGLLYTDQYMTNGGMFHLKMIDGELTITTIIFLDEHAYDDQNGNWGYTLSFGDEERGISSDEAKAMLKRWFPHLNHDEYEYVMEGNYLNEEGFTGLDTLPTADIHDLSLLYAAANPSSPFTDIKSADWYYNAIVFCNDNGIMSGVGGGAFNPGGTLNRAMMATILYKLAGNPSVTYSAVFSDVPSGQWYSEAITWAAANGIVGGVGGGAFNPDGNITREQMTTLLYNFARYKGYDTAAAADLSAYPDAGAVSSWARDGISWCVAEGLVSGIGGKLEPNGTATRAQCAVIMQRFVENIAG